MSQETDKVRDRPNIAVRVARAVVGTVLFVPLVGLWWLLICRDGPLQRFHAWRRK